MTGCVRKFESNLTMSFKISDKQLLKKYNEIWKRAETLLKIEFEIFKAKKCQKQKHHASVYQ